MSDKVYIIVKGGAYYRPNSRGYTTTAICAGRYTKDEAEQITHPNGPDGPRDGMWYMHEDECKDEDWRAHKAALKRIAELEAALKLAHDQYMGCGGNLRPQEIVDAMKRICREALEGG